jgi:lipid-A-disaccharide synthase
MATVLISCGEASGETYAAEVAEHLRKRRPDLRLVGVGGELLAAQVESRWASLEELSVMGFAEVLRHLPRLRRLRERLAARAREEGVDLLVAVDYPGFHVSLAGAMARRGIATLHYIPPKTWSWGAWRNRSLRRNVRRCAVIFPFEEAYYQERGIDARFVGHPLLDRHGETLTRPADRREGLLLVPGSRAQEIQRVGPVMARAAALLQREGRVERIRVSQAATVDPRWLAPLRAVLPSVEVVEGPLMDHLRRAAAAVVCSGTATVETALSRTPHAICYRTSPLTYAVARALATVPAIGMANIVLGRVAFPEFLQGGLRERPLAAALGPLLEPGSDAVRAQEAAFDELTRRLGRGEGAGANVAAMAVEMLDAAGA